MSQDVSSDVRLSMTRNARAWRAGMVTTGAAVNPSEMAGRVNGSAVLRSAPALRGGAKKSEATKPKAWLEQTRASWAEQANRALARPGCHCRYQTPGDPNLVAR